MMPHLIHSYSWIHKTYLFYDQSLFTLNEPVFLVVCVPPVSVVVVLAPTLPAVELLVRVVVILPRHEQVPGGHGGSVTNVTWSWMENGGWIGGRGP